MIFHSPNGHGAALGVGLKPLKRVVPRRLSPLGVAIGQYRPRRLTVPARYLRTRPPERAPTVSIVTPTYNQGRYVTRTLESVLSQRYPKLEYIVIDGGSEDGAVEALERYRGRLHHLESRPDDGPASAINEGFARSSGEIMAWLNSDDVLLPGSLAYVARYFAEHPEVDLVYGHRVLVDDEDRDIGIWVTPRHCPDSLLWYDFVPQETAFWRRRIWDRVGGIDESFMIAFDWDFFSRLHRSGARIMRLPRFLGAYRQHPNQLTRVRRKTALQEHAAIRERWNGRPLTRDEIRAGVFPFLVRSLPYLAGYGAIARLPGRVEVALPR